MTPVQLSSQGRRKWWLIASWGDVCCGSAL